MYSADVLEGEGERLFGGFDQTGGVYTQSYAGTSRRKLEIADKQLDDTSVMATSWLLDRINASEN